MAPDGTTTRQRLLVDLINTLHTPDGRDALSGTEAAAWLRQHSSGPGSPQPLDGRRVRELQAVREGLRQLALANNGQLPDPAVLERAEDALVRTPLRLRLDDPPHLAPWGRLGDRDDLVAQAVAATAHAYLAERAAGTWRRVKACANTGCMYAFVDSSRNASRRWCDMAGCGNKAKQTAWRTRRVAHPEGITGETG